jgi:DNA-binding NarL/FixJ family response regulator
MMRLFTLIVVIAGHAILAYGDHRPGRFIRSTSLESDRLSSREQEVVDLVVRGASTRQISQTLYISEYTVRDHLKNTFGKVGVRGRRALVEQLYLDTIFP